MNDIIIREIELPASVRAFTIPDAQGDYNIYLNSALSAEQKEKSLTHEKEHIRRGDFYRDASALEIEKALT